MVEERSDPDPPGRLALAALFPPPSLVSITAGESIRPGVADEVGDENNEGPRDDDISRFELPQTGQTDYAC